jgi:hypothetical protein
MSKSFCHIDEFQDKKASFARLNVKVLRTITYLAEQSKDTLVRVNHPVYTKVAFINNP